MEVYKKNVKLFKYLEHENDIPLARSPATEISEAVIVQPKQQTPRVGGSKMDKEVIAFSVYSKIWGFFCYLFFLVFLLLFFYVRGAAARGVSKCKGKVLRPIRN